MILPTMTPKEITKEVQEDFLVSTKSWAWMSKDYDRKRRRGEYSA